MSGDLLQRIQTLQFHHKAQAEALLLTFLRDIFSPDVAGVELRPLAVSLNSFNGFMTLADGKRLFFKTHTEPDGMIGEYYNAAHLAQAGYPVIQPVFSSTEAGKQLLVYEVIDAPSVFDLAWKIENGESDLLPELTTAQNAADDRLFRLYQQTFLPQSADESAQAPVHQLFYHRLTGGRLERFYGNGTQIALPAGQYPMSQVLQARWNINGQRYAASLNELIQQAARLLNPSQAGLSIVGHGDAHNGNVFFQGEPPSLLYFDPAFAGRHHPLLDLTKPLFHNVFAMWMYFPQVKAQRTHIRLQIKDNTWFVEHDYALHPVREMFLQSKVERVLLPTLRELQAQKALRSDWRAYLKAALFCCPFLTMNLTDGQKFPPEISLLGLAMAVEMGAESQETRSDIDHLLDSLEQHL